MCGIFGIIVKEKSSVNSSFITKALKDVASRSVSRGKDSSGVVFKNNKQQTFQLVKGDIPVYELLKSNAYKKHIKEALVAYNAGSNFQAMGHARLVTNGSQLKEENNQPVIKDGIVTIHNGIIVNVDKLWENNPRLTRKYDIDTEILPSLIRDKINKGEPLPVAISQSMNQVEGTVSVALFFDDRHDFVLTTNNGSLYYILDNDFLVFASEEFFLKSFIKKFKLQNNEVKKVHTGEQFILNTLNFKSFVSTNNKPPQHTSVEHVAYTYQLENLKGPLDAEVVIDPSVYVNKEKDKLLYSLLENNKASINKLKRCTKCLLPETFPFIHYDAKGECNYCLNYKPKAQIQPMDKLHEIIKKYKRSDGKPDCLVPFSGGRDSTYSLHIIKKELGLNPIAFTYDWGMVTDLARRNAARVCGKLGVENIIVAADIHEKRKNIRKNVAAWLKQPSLGMIPLFMAGDKYFFYYSNKILKQNNLELSVYGSNPFENTDFKSGFAGIEPVFNKARIDELKIKNKIKLASFFGKNFAVNPAYFNSSLKDTMGAFASRYVIERKGYLQLFDFFEWEETKLEKLIFSEYDWEKSIDTSSTWRIGDGTAAFYNYIYYTVAGFSEFDTFRSNQIREGHLTREQGLALTDTENTPRYETIRWYLDIIGLDFKTVIKTVNKIPKLYPHAY
ncbi:MAG: hypothetical protein WBM13_03845 [Bacteroidia bacterium]